MKLTIITVNYNDAVGLEKAIQSVQSQTYQDFEHIIIDGNSDDGSKAIIEKHKDSFSYWVSEPDMGIYNAMNKGIKVAKGDYLLFLNSGDWLFDDEVLVEVSKQINGRVDIYYGKLILNRINKSKTIVQCSDKLSFDFFLKSTIPHQAAFTKRELFNRVGYFNENFKIVADWEFFLLAIFRNNASYKYIDIVISYYDTNGISSISENKKLFAKEKKNTLEKYFSPFLADYKELVSKRKILKSNRFKMLQELENSKIAKKLNSLFLRVNLIIFRRKTLKDL